MIVQEYIPGIEYTVDILADEKGEPILIIPRKRIETKAGISVKVNITSLKLDDEFMLFIRGKC